ncbi:pyroglutamyl-peptidase I [Streptococcus sp. DD13]|uniref:pyroglutamyl-peptidase I n=1 Tax=Streptococcus sp. DD13 TaxID=1777881 RepID=UPI00079B2700|nr:pyroglutamyl-peptidase I [Streptococcus sp. DD13]KXT77955.1 Pyrrolidone-carboxylate peptidase [Streptococcus sp. DD13]
MKILVTAFEPFGGEAINPALEAVKRLPQTIKGAQISWLQVPTVFGESAEILAQAISDQRPDAVLCVGQAGGRMGLSPERVAINLDDARIPDNKGQQPLDQPIQPDGPAAYFSTLPIKAMVQAIKKAGIPASVSNSAGTFVCNHLMYQALYLADQAYPEMRAGFLHIPYLLEQVLEKSQTPAMGLEDIIRGLEAAIGAIVTYSKDLQIAGGALH